jgi:hypothetical protein
LASALALAAESEPEYVAHLAYKTEALCEAAGEEIKARANEKRWTIDYRCINSNQRPVWLMR